MHPLTEWRKDQGYTLKEAAEFLQVPQATLTDWIYCRRFPRGANVTKIAEKTEGAVTSERLHEAWQKLNRPEAAE